MKILYLIPVLFLAACGTPRGVPVEVPVTKQVVVLPSNDFYNCPDVDLPDPKTLTEKQISKLIFKYENSNNVCRKNLRKIKLFLENSKRRIEDLNK